MHERCKGVQRKEEEVLYDDGSSGKTGRGERRRFLNSRPCQIDVKEEKENSESDN